MLLYLKTGFITIMLDVAENLIQKMKTKMYFKF